MLDARIAEAIAALKEADKGRDKRKAKERKEDLMRLKRVEQIYVRFIVFPMFHCVRAHSEFFRVLFFLYYPAGYLSF